MATRQIYGQFAGGGAEADVTGCTYTVPANQHVDILQYIVDCEAATWAYITDLLNVHLFDIYMAGAGHIPITFEQPIRFTGNAAGTTGIKARKGAGANQTAVTMIVDEPPNG